MSRPLGANQEGVLDALYRHGLWKEWGTAWVWDTAGGTRRILESLERRGLTERRDSGVWRLSRRGVCLALERQPGSHTWPDDLRAETFKRLGHTYKGN